MFPKMLLYQVVGLKICTVADLHSTVLMEECILDVFYWFLHQVLAQGVTEFQGGSEFGNKEDHGSVGGL